MSFYTSSLDKLPIKTLTNHTIVLDLDETLLHSSENMTDLQNLGIFSNPNLMDIRRRTYVITLDDVVDKRGSGVKTQLWGIKRPHLDEFLVFCFSYFKVVAVWSAGQTKYVDAIVNKIFGNIAMPHIVYSWPDCDSNKNGTEKPLNKMIAQIPGLDNYMSLNNTFFIDDRKSNFDQNPDNGILIPPYNPKPTINSLREDDLALLQLKSWLLLPMVRNSTDVTTLNKSKIFITPLNSSNNLTNNSIIPNNFNDPLISNISEDFKRRLTISDTILESPILQEQSSFSRSPFLPKGCYLNNGGIICNNNLDIPPLLNENKIY